MLHAQFHFGTAFARNVETCRCVERCGFGHAVTRAQLGVGGCVSCGFFLPVDAVGLCAEPLDAAGEADAVVGGKGQVGVDEPVVACLVFEAV